MAEAYPLPSHAASFWVAGDDLMIAFPGTEAGRGHTIRLPASAGGFAAAVKIMRDRALSSSHRLSERGTPSQYEIERALVQDKNYAHILGALTQTKETNAAAKREAAQELKELGL